MSDISEIPDKDNLLQPSNKISPIKTLYESEKIKSDNKILDSIQTSNFKSGDNTLRLRIKIPKNSKSSKSSFNSTIMSNLGNVRNYGMSQYQSSSSLVNSVQSWSFKKEHKFKDTYKSLLTDSIYNLPEQKHLRSTSIGIGKRYDFLPLEGRGVPGADNYNIKSQIEINMQKKKGALIFTNSNKIKRPDANILGPGSYNISRELPLTQGSPIAIKSRFMFFYDQDIRNQKHCISPQTYLPSTKATENWRYTQIGFGIGKKISCENKFTKAYPGPGSYDLPSVFDKTKKNKLALN